MYAPLQTGVVDQRADGKFYVSRSSLEDHMLLLASSNGDELDLLVTYDTHTMSTTPA